MKDIQCSEPFTRRPILSTTYRANGPGPCTRQKNRVNGNEAHLLDERLRFGSAGSLTIRVGINTYKSILYGINTV